MPTNALEDQMNLLQSSGEVVGAAGVTNGVTKDQMILSGGELTGIANQKLLNDHLNQLNEPRPSASLTKPGEEGPVRYLPPKRVFYQPPVDWDDSCGCEDKQLWVRTLVPAPKFVSTAGPLPVDPPKKDPPAVSLPESHFPIKVHPGLQYREFLF